MSPSYRNQSNQLTGFYVREILVAKGLQFLISIQNGVVTLMLAVVILGMVISFNDTLMRNCFFSNKGKS